MAHKIHTVDTTKVVDPKVVEHLKEVNKVVVDTTMEDKSSLQVP